MNKYENDESPIQQDSSGEILRTRRARVCAGKLSGKARKHVMSFASYRPSSLSSSLSSIFESNAMASCEGAMSVFSKSPVLAYGAVVVEEPRVSVGQHHHLGL